tara:strand:- start:351 stop:752 length:402 start_codon:yes stop_codon:yes gene_type:complete
MRLAVALFFLATSVSAESSSLSLQLPSPPMNYQADKFRAGNLDCSNAVGGSTTLEFGTTGVLTNMNTAVQGKDIGIYARIVIPLDKPRTRINCDDLFQLELSQRRLEVQVLRAELEQMKRMQSENNNSMDFEN